MATVTYPSVVLLKLINDGHQLEAHARDIYSRLMIVDAQLATGERISNRRWAHHQWYQNQPPSPTMQALRARIRRRLYGSWWRVEELGGAMVVLEMEAIHLLMAAGYVLEDGAVRGQFITPHGVHVDIYSR